MQRRQHQMLVNIYAFLAPMGLRAVPVAALEVAAAAADVVDAAAAAAAALFVAAAVELLAPAAAPAALSDTVNCTIKITGQ